METYLRVNFLGPGPLFIKKEFTWPRCHRGWETLAYSTCRMYRYFVQRIASPMDSDVKWALS